MNREILFRGKRDGDGEWVMGDRAGYSDYVMIWDLIDKGVGYLVDHTTVGQFTGLCDKNGVKIFEGDVVFAGYGEYYQGTHEHSTTIIIDMADYEALNALCNANVVEVIGNVHDTPELAKEESE